MDLNDLSKPNLQSSYANSDVPDTLLGHIKRLWKGDYTGMANLVSGMRRWSVANKNLQLIQTNSDGSESVVFDLSVSAGQVATGGVPSFDGIKFPATQIPSSNANTLDDYEEGSWTPAIAGATAAGTALYSRQFGRYTKIGNVVTVFFDVKAYQGLSGAVGQLVLTGLPFQVATTSTYTDGNGSTISAKNVGAGMTSEYYGLNLSTQYYAISFTAIAQSNAASFASCGSNSGSSNQIGTSNANSSSSPAFAGCITYITN